MTAAVLTETAAVTDAAERAAALDPTASFLVEAPAGSGKTELLVRRMLRLLCRVDQPESVLALTFTRKATAEMRERVLSALDLVAQDPASLDDYKRETRCMAATLLAHDRQLGWDLRENSHRLNIRTLDSLSGEIARSLPLVSGAIGQLSPVDDARPLYGRAARAVMLRLGGSDDALNQALRDLLLHRDANLQEVEKLLADMLGTREQWARLFPLTGELSDCRLDENVRPAIDRTLEALVCRTLKDLRRVFPERELGELTGLAEEIAREDGHAGSDNPMRGCAGLRHLPGHAAADAVHWSMLAHLLLNKDTSWRKVRALQSRNLRFDIDPFKARLQDLLERLADRDDVHAALCRLRNLPPAAMPDEDWCMTRSLFRLLHAAVAELQHLFRHEQVCDFTELSLAARNALTTRDSAEHEDHATPALGGHLPQHLLVDEMQDTSHAQYELLERLTQGWDGTTRTVFLVGDPKQSIYLFRQARVERFVNSLQHRRLGDVPLSILRLTTNFRSAAPLVAEFNNIFERVFADSGDRTTGIAYTPASPARAASPGELVWHVDTPWSDPVSGDCRQSSRRLRREQADHIVQTVRALRQGTDQPTMAVLVRSREHAAAITRAFRAGGVPFRGVDLEPLAERPEVLDALAITRALLHPADRVAWLAVLRAPWCGATLSELHTLVGDDQPAPAADQRGLATAQPGSTDPRDRRDRTIRALVRSNLNALPVPSRPRIQRTLDTLDRAATLAGRMPIAELVERTGRALGIDALYNSAERTNLRRYLELLAQTAADPQPVDAAALEVRLASLYATPDTTPGAVDIMTIHKAKGLEWDVVFLPELHRRTTTNAPRLLDWLEVDDRATDVSGVLLAPIQPKGEAAAQLKRYVQAAHAQLQAAEVARLLYVAVTRARHTLHLYAAPERRTDGEVTREPGTLLRAGWPGFGDTVQYLATESALRHETELPALFASGETAPGDADGMQWNSPHTTSLAVLRRVPAGFAPGGATRIFSTGSHERKDRPDSLVEQVQRSTGGISSRAVGQAVHLFLRHLAERIAHTGQSGPADLLRDIEQWTPRIRAVLRSSGTMDATMQADAQIVLTALRNTLQDPIGRWLLQAHPQATSELTMADPATGRILRLDRSFLAGRAAGEPGTDTLWIVDFKTATPGDDALEAFLRSNRERYAAQLRNYGRLHATSETAGRTMFALYYPLLPAFDAWSADPVRSGPGQTANSGTDSAVTAASLLHER